jgi:alpha-tubulin suppressor-like RCC1 family protein
MFGQRVSKICCGAAHNLVLLQNGLVFSWGNGVNGRLGHGDTESLVSPKQIELFSDRGLRVTDICCGWTHSFVIVNNDTLYSFGKGQDGQLGIGSIEDRSIPTLVDFTFGTIICVSSFYHTLLFSAKGLFSWGWGEHGQLGLGDLFNQPTPQFVDVSPHKVSTVACGAFHSVITTAEGKLLSWGGNADAQLGHGDNTTQVIPYVVDFLNHQHIIEVTCGFRHTLAVQGLCLIFFCSLGIMDSSLLTLNIIFLVCQDQE